MRIVTGGAVTGAGVRGVDEAAVRDAARYRSGEPRRARPQRRGTSRSTRSHRRLRPGGVRRTTFVASSRASHGLGFHPSWSRRAPNAYARRRELDDRVHGLAIGGDAESRVCSPTRRPGDREAIALCSIEDVQGSWGDGRRRTYVDGSGMGFGEDDLARTGRARYGSGGRRRRSSRVDRGGVGRGERPGAGDGPVSGSQPRRRRRRPIVREHAAGPRGGRVPARPRLPVTV